MLLVWHALLRRGAVLHWTWMTTSHRRCRWRRVTGQTRERPPRTSSRANGFIASNDETRAVLDAWPEKRRPDTTDTPSFPLRKAAFIYQPFRVTSVRRRGRVRLTASVHTTARSNRVRLLPNGRPRDVLRRFHRMRFAVERSLVGSTRMFPRGLSVPERTSLPPCFQRATGGHDARRWSNAGDTGIGSEYENCGLIELSSLAHLLLEQLFRTKANRSQR